MCKEVKVEKLMAWMDDELPTYEATAIEEHVGSCQSCEDQVVAWQTAAGIFCDMVDAGVGEVEPLIALQQIRHRIAEIEENSWAAKFQRFKETIWPEYRHLALGFSAAAIVLLSLTPNFTGGWDNSENLSESSGQPVELAMVTVESLEFDVNSKAVIYKPNGGTTTIIWVEPNLEIAQ